MKSIVEDSITLAKEIALAGDEAKVRDRLREELSWLGTCPTCGHTLSVRLQDERWSVLSLAKEIGINRFVLMRFLRGGSPRLKNYLAIVRWLVSRKEVL